MAAIRSVFFTPPLAVARVGGSPTPVDAYVWYEDPSLQGGGLTALLPCVSLRVEDDGSVACFRPTELVFRDGPLLRPVAPFLELWAEHDDGSVAQLTSTALAAGGGSLAGVTYTVEAANRKAERRTLDPSCGFAATVEFDHAAFAPVALLASSPGPAPLVSPEDPVPLGTIQPLRPVADPDDPDGSVRDVLRLRFTPGAGLVYGPRSVGLGNGGAGPMEIVRPANRILSDGTTWEEYSISTRTDEGRCVPDRSLPHPQPSDTYDGSGDDMAMCDRSWGVVDDTCDVLVTAIVRIGDESHVCQTRIFVGPPDYAPDKRPFVSLLDDLLDREVPDPEFNPRLTELEVTDLLRRAFETISLNAVDGQRWRAVRENGDAASQLIRAADARQQAVLRGRLGFETLSEIPPLANRETMTDDDVGFRAADRNQLKTDTRYPFADMAGEAHAALTSMPILLAFLAADAARVRRLLRPPYALVRESAPGSAQAPLGRRRPWDPDAYLHDMRMPPYMRDSDASPLSLSRRQYVQVMSLVDHLERSARVDALEATRELRLLMEEEEPVAADPQALFDAFQRTDLTTDVPELPVEPRP